MSLFSRHNFAHPFEIDTAAMLTYFVVALLLVNVAIALRAVLPVLTTPLILMGLIFLPGTLLALSLKLRSGSIIDLTLYSFALGLAFWLLGALAIDGVLPQIGIARPLDLPTIWVFFDAAAVLLLLFVWHARRTFHWTIKPLNRKELYLTIVPPLFILLSLVGSALLNRGQESGGDIILLMILGITVYAFTLATSSRPVRESVYGWGIWCCALSLLLMYSMRSAHILGWDINSEYQLFTTTQQNGVWTTTQVGNKEYNTCLSITILPTVLGNFLPVAAEYVYKFIFQMFFAFLPVTVFALGKRYVSLRAAFLSAFLFFGQTWFYEQMPALIRQEVALVFFGCALLAIFDPFLKRRQQVGLFLLFSLTLILSHYSTAYVYLALLLLELVIFSLLRLLMPALRIFRARLNWKLFFVLVAFTFIWEGVITEVGGAFTNFATDIPAHITEAFASDTLQDNLSRMIFNSSDANTEENLLDQYTKVSANYASLGLDLYPAAAYSGYVPETVSLQPAWPALVPAAAGGYISLALKVVKILAIVIFPLFGVIYFLTSFRRKRGGQISEFIALGLAGIPLILAIILLPIFQVNYNISRLFMQAYVVLALTSVAGGMVFLRCRIRNKAAIFGSTALFCLLFLFSTGGAEKVLGGDQRITLATDQELTDPCYIYDSEVAAARHLERTYDGKSLVYADTLASLRLHSFTTINENLRYHVFPSAITQDGYVYLDKANTAYGVAYTSQGSGIISYEEPSAFLENNKDLIYNNGSAKIYR